MGNCAVHSTRRSRYCESCILAHKPKPRGRPKMTTRERDAKLEAHIQAHELRRGEACGVEVVLSAIARKTYVVQDLGDELHYEVVNDLILGPRF